MNIFIDIGCYDGDTVEQFRNWKKLAFPARADWTIHAFDPNPTFREKWETMKDGNTFFYQKAAWIEDTELLLALEDSLTPVGSTVMPGKQKIWNNSEKISVPAFDLSKWVKQFKEDYVVIKLDCEGAEFPILEKMIEDKTVQVANILLVEFHPNKVVEYTTEHKLDLIKRVQELGVEIYDWH